jgi:hypothetical protein
MRVNNSKIFLSVLGAVAGVAGVGVMLSLPAAAQTRPDANNRPGVIDSNSSYEMDRSRGNLSSPSQVDDVTPRSTNDTFMDRVFGANDDGVSRRRPDANDRPGVIGASGGYERDRSMGNIGSPSQVDDVRPRGRNVAGNLDRSQSLGETIDNVVDDIGDAVDNVDVDIDLNNNDSNRTRPSNERLNPNDRPGVIDSGSSYEMDRSRGNLSSPSQVDDVTPR